MYRVVKRTIDVAVSLFGLVLFSPLFACIAVVNLIIHGRPVLFRQTRPGLNAAMFNMVKFRTMNHATDEHGNLLPDKVRLTRWGRFLRTTSLDEIPELWNVLRGDMSLIGPRPLLPEYLAHYTEAQKRRHEVRPGITGLAQVAGRNALTWEQKFAYDVIYVDSMSFVTDLKILMRTMGMVLKREGINTAEGDAMPKFGSHGSETQ